ncbi:MAG: hypothetical protein COB84_00755 [Rhodobacteraceae bacterium]|nr:MAG: hypothetical protein COB84_00755 [Paracoccaceae bacterium]
MLASLFYTVFVWSPFVLVGSLIVILIRGILPDGFRVWPFKLVTGLLIATYVFGFLHYTLPQRDVVLIIDAYEKRMDVSTNSIFWGQPDAGTASQDTRDVRFIDAQYANGDVVVFRNEDTGFSWPPYLKFDSSDLSARAKQLISTPENPKWVAVRHYGWRNNVFSIFPNATSFKIVPTADTRLIPWFNIIIIFIALLLGLGIFRLLQRFKQRRIDPVLEDIEDSFDSLSERTQRASNNAQGRMGRFWDTILGRSK